MNFAHIDKIVNTIIENKFDSSIDDSDKSFAKNSSDQTKLNKDDFQVLPYSSQPNTDMPDSDKFGVVMLIPFINSAKIVIKISNIKKTILFFIFLNYFF